MKRIKTMVQAVIYAGSVCQEWKFIEGSETLEVTDMINIGMGMDEKNPLEEDFFYMVSGEGAIGIACKWEFLTKWLYVPAETIMQSQEEATESGEDRNENVKSASNEGGSEKGKPTSNEDKDEKEMPVRFCRNCGNRMKPDAIFCNQCGTKVQ